MRSIVIDLSGFDKGPSIVSQAIKVFSEKNKFVQIFAVGNQKDMLSLSNEKNITCVSAYNEGDVKPRNDDYVYLKAWEVMKDKNADVLITPADKHAILKSARSNLTLKGFPVFVTAFLSNNPGRFCLLGDCGANNSLNKNQYFLLQEEAAKYMQSTLSVSKPTYGIISTSDNQLDLTDSASEAVDFFENKEGFKGIVPIDRMLEGKIDIYLTDGFTGEIIIKSMYSMYKMYADKYAKYLNEDFKAKVANFFASGMNKDINRSTSYKLDMTGLSLLGYDKLVVKANKTTNVGGLIGTLNTVNKYLIDLTSSEAKQ